MNGRIRVLLAIIMTLSLSFGPASGIRPAAAETTVITLTIGNPSITVNGVQRAIDAGGTTPVIVAGRTLLPIRAVVEAIGGTIEWDATTRTVTITAGTVTMGLTIGNRMANVNGTMLPIDPQNAGVVPLIVGGRTMLPVRFVGEQLGGMVEWNAATKTATLTFVAPAPLTASSLVEPADGALFTSTTVAFRWTPVDGATSYSLAISSEGKEIYRGTSTTNTLIPSSTVLTSGQYSWTVTAVRGATTGPVSLSRRFTVHLQLSPAEIVRRTTPAIAGIAVSYVDGTRGIAGAFCIDPSGVFVTTYEIIKGAVDGTITLADGSQRSDLRVLGYDTAMNIAVIRGTGDKSIASLALAGGQSAQINQDVIMVGPILAGVPQFTVMGTVNGVAAGTFTVRGSTEDTVEGCPVLDSFGDVVGMVTIDAHPLTGTFPSVFAGTIRAVAQTGSWTIREITEREGTGLQALDKPMPSEPVAGAVIGNLRPRFHWNAVAGATRYEVRVVVGLDASGTLLFDDIISYTDPIVEPGIMKPGTSYAWNVRAGNEHGWGPWSLTRLFTTSATIIQPPIPTVLEPLDGTTVKAVEPVLFWTALPGSNRYYVWVGASGQEEVFTGSSTTTSLAIPAGTLSSGSTYVWNVRVENSSGVSSLWSPDNSFTMAVPAGIGVPSLLSPIPQAIVPYLNPTLTWQSVAGATGYDVWIDKGTSESKVYEVVVTDTSATVPAGILEPGVIYRWNVIAGTPDAWSKTGNVWNWSLARVFTINLTAVIDILKPHLLSPADGVVLTTLSPILKWSTVQGAAWYRVYIGKGTIETELEQVLSVIVMPKGGDTQQFTLSPGTLESGATYFWRVLAGAGEDIESPAFYHFETPQVP